MYQQIVMTGLQSYFEDAVRLTNEPDSLIFKNSKFNKIYAGINVPFYNSIFNISLNDNEMKSFLDGLEKEQKQLGIPLTIWVQGNMRQLIERGYETPGPNFGMVLDVNRSKLTPIKKEVKVVKVESEEQVDQFVDIFVSVFGFQHEIKFFRKLHKQILHSDSPPWINYLGMLDGVAVGCSSLTLSQDGNGKLLGGFYNAAVLPEGRGKGVATAMACKRVMDAKELDIDHISIILMASAMARGYCEKMGFQDCCEISPYLIQG